MATIKDTGATNALNEDEYINKLYDNVIEKQKNLLTENQNAATSELDALKESVQQQTNTNLGRVNVEAQKAQQNYNPPNVSSSAQQQIALAMDNQKKKNTTATLAKQNDADAEIERQRKLLGEQYALAIKQAQAENDMVRAQQLYEAAKQEDAQLTALKQKAGEALAAAGDNSILDSILAGEAVARDTTGQTWADVTKNEDSINKIYDSAIESAKLEAQMANNEALAKIEAAQAAETAATDKNLNQAYVNALKSNKNYNEVQNAYGLGSGNMAQQQLARALGTTETLTNLRNVLAENAAQRGQQRLATGEVYRDNIANAIAKNEQNRAAALYDAAEAEEQALIDAQQKAGATLAEQNDYSVLGKLYGLTQDQIDRLQGTGAYTPVESTSGSGGRGTGDGTDDEEFGNPEDTATTSSETLELGRGPISQNELKNLVSNGSVTSVKTDDGYKLVNTDPNTGLPTYDGKPASKGTELARKVVTSGMQEPSAISKVDAVSSAAPKASTASAKTTGTTSTSTKNTATQKVANAIKQASTAPIVDEPAAAAGKAIGTAIANAIKKLINKKK